MKRWIVTISYSKPFAGTALVEVDAATREHAAQLARGSRRWPPGSTFSPRQVDLSSYAQEFLDSVSGQLLDRMPA